MTKSFSVRAAAKLLVPETGQEISCLADFLAFPPKVLERTAVRVVLSMRARAIEIGLPGIHINLVMVGASSWADADTDRLAGAVLITRHFMRAAGVAIHRHLYSYDVGAAPSPPSGSFLSGWDTEKTLLAAAKSYLTTMKSLNQTANFSTNYIPIYFAVAAPPTIDNSPRIGQVGTLCESCVGNPYSGLLGAVIWNVAFITAPQSFQFPQSLLDKVFPAPSPNTWSSETSPPTSLLDVPSATVSPLAPSVAREWMMTGSVLMHELMHVLGLVHSTEAADGAACSACSWWGCCPEFDDINGQSKAVAAQHVVGNIMFPTVGQGFQLVPSQVALVKKHCAVHPPMMKLP